MMLCTDVVSGGYTSDESVNECVRFCRVDGEKQHMASMELRLLSTLVSPEIIDLLFCR